MQMQVIDNCIYKFWVIWSRLQNKMRKKGLQLFCFLAFSYVTLASYEEVNETCNRSHKHRGRHPEACCWAERSGCHYCTIWRMMRSESGISHNLFLLHPYSSFYPSSLCLPLILFSVFLLDNFTILPSIHNVMICCVYYITTFFWQMF